jgi:hypothetical protein
MLRLYNPEDFKHEIGLKGGWGSNDNRFVDTDTPVMRCPSFLQFNKRDCPYLAEQMIKSFKWTGKGVLEGRIIEYGDDIRPYKSPVVEYMNKAGYKIQNIRVLYKGREWVQSLALTIYHLANGYRLSAPTGDPRTLELNEDGYVYINLLYRDKTLHGHLPQTGADELIKWINVLQTMPGAPPYMFYLPFGEMNETHSPHLAHLNMEYIHTTEQLRKIWARKLGGVKTRLGYGKHFYHLCTRYNPTDPAELPEHRIIPEFEEVLGSLK